VASRDAGTDGPVIDPYRRRLALLVASCYFMENLDGTIVTTAAPQLRAALHVSSTAVGLLIASYLITFAVVIPVGHWLMSRVGERPLLLAAIATFTVASLLCALSGTMTELVLARCCQGAGAALMVPVGRIIVLAHSTKSDIMRLVAYIVWPSLLAPALAPLVGGLIVTWGSWPWLFLPNVPLGVGALVAGLIIMRPSTRRSRAAVPLDWRGLVLTGISLGALVYSGFVAGEITSTWARVGLDVTVAGAALALAVGYLRRRREPFLDLSLFRVTTFRQSVRGLVPFTMTVGAVPLVLPLMFEDRFSWSPVRSGALVLFVFVGNLAAKPATTPLLNRWGYRRVLVTSTALVSVSMVSFAFVTRTTPVVVIALLCGANGVVRSVGYSGYLTLVYGDVDEQHMTHATTLAATVQQVAAGFAASAGVVALRLGTSWTHSGSLASPRAYQIAFVLLAALGATSVVNAAGLDARAGDALRTVRARD